MADGGRAGVLLVGVGAMRYLEGTKPPWPDWPWGVHWYPGTHTATRWEDPGTRENDLAHLKAMGIKWVTLLSEPGEGDLNRIVGGKEYARWWLDNEIVPIVRVYGMWDGGWGGLDTLVKKMVPVWADYGMKPILIPGNEAGDAREWRNGKTPGDWLARSTRIWEEQAQVVLTSGGRVLYPDPLGHYAEMWFQLIDRVDWFLAGLTGFAGHFYGLGRPVNFPYDQPEPGEPWRITQAEWESALDDFVNDPTFRDIYPDMINAQRSEWRDSKEVATFTNCFNVWKAVDQMAWDILDISSLVVCMTEGGWTPRDNPWQDCRYPRTTPKQVAKKTLEVFKATDHGMFAMTPWIWNGEPGWYTESWFGGAYMDVVDRDTGLPYGIEKPVVKALKAAEKPGDNLPGGDPDWGKIAGHVEAIREALS